VSGTFIPAENATPFVVSGATSLSVGATGGQLCSIRIGHTFRRINSGIQRYPGESDCQGNTDVFHSQNKRIRN
jgi:hypothetical protein